MIILFNKKRMITIQKFPIYKIKWINKLTKNPKKVIKKSVNYNLK